MRIVIVGGSAAGLCSALLLARDGHDVIVLDQDPLVPAPDVDAAARSAWRATVPQIVQPHALLPRARELLRTTYGDVLDALLVAGAIESPLHDQMPPSLVDRRPFPGDERLTMIMTRRSTFDWVLLTCATAQQGISLRGGVRVTGLLTRAGSSPSVHGVVTKSGNLAADVVIDATGRRSPIDRWLAAAGAQPAYQASAECGLAYFSRHYQLRPGRPLPGPKATRLLMPLAEFTVGLWSADNGTMLFAVAPLTTDRRFAKITDPAVFTATLRTVPIFDAWLDVLEPIGPVYAMAGLHNTLRRQVVNRVPIVTGLLAVGDSVCTTNPTLGRGVALALQGAADVRDVLQRTSDPAEAALELDDRVEQHVVPFYVDQATNDAARLAALRHAVFGDALPDHRPPPPGRVDFTQLRTVAMIDPVVFRAFFHLLGMLELPEAVYTDPQVVTRVRNALHDQMNIS